jgi:hypothetical protein
MYHGSDKMSEVFPTWNGETDQEYKERVARLNGLNESYIVLIHERTFTPGLRGVEVFQPKLKNAFFCQAVKPEDWKITVVHGLQSLVNMGGPLPMRGDVFFGDYCVKEPIHDLGSIEIDIFSKVHSKELEPEPELESPVVEKSVIEEQKSLAFDAMTKRQEQEAHEKAERERKERGEFNAKLKAEADKAKKVEQKNNGLAAWF